MSLNFRDHHRKQAVLGTGQTDLLVPDSSLYPFCVINAVDKLHGIGNYLGAKAHSPCLREFLHWFIGVGITIPGAEVPRVGVPGTGVPAEQK